jgi:hypothetical protein
MSPRHAIVVSQITHQGDDVNQTAHTGKLVQPIKEDTTRGGRPVARLRVAFEATAPGRRDVHMDVRLYDEPATALVAAAPPVGTTVAITGGLDRDEYQQGGQRTHSTYIVATDVEVLATA